MKKITLKQILKITSKRYIFKDNNDGDIEWEYSMHAESKLAKAIAEEIMRFINE